MAEQPSFANTWLRQREAGAGRIEAIERAELRNLDAAEALRLSEALLDAVPLEAITKTRRDTSGFVEQQRLFGRARKSR